MVTEQLANKPTVSQVVDWQTRIQVNSPTRFIQNLQ